MQDRTGRLACLVWATALVVGISPAASAQSAARFYDAQGRYVGRADPGRAASRLYDGQGRYLGQARSGNAVGAQKGDAAKAQDRGRGNRGSR